MQLRAPFVCRLLAVFAGAMLLGAALVAAYQYIYTYKTKITALEHQVALLSAAIEESNLVSEANTEQLRELANRREVAARSQDDLLTDAVAAVAPAVVSIVISKDVALLEVAYVNPFGDDPMFRNFDIRVPRYRQIGTETQQVGAGTGFIVREDGYIVTNRHVVDDPEASYTVLLSTGEERLADVVYRDTTYDLAILKIEGDGYPTLPLGDSSMLRLGQTVAAIGNALGEYSNSVSVGIISGLDRTIEAHTALGRFETIPNVIQTDAAINRGNSGGPLIDLNGHAVGVNVAIRPGANDIAFALPSNVVRDVLTRVLP